MGGAAADERETRQVHLLEPVLEHLRKEMASLPIPNELVVEIFLRIPNPADLLRASAACVSFRGLIADRAFLRLYRRLHAPPLLGFLEYERNVFHPAATPHPSAPAASVAVLAADFSFSFLATPATDWRVQDVRDGRILLDRAPHHDIDNRYKLVFPELVVCDPLHRRYLLLPPIPAHLAATVKHPLWRKRHRYCETFLAPPGDSGEAAEETSFRVVWMTQCETKLVAFVFSSSTGQWRAIPSQSWSDLFAGLLSSTGLTLFSWRQYAYGCFYWVTHWRERLLVLDTWRMEFSIAEPPIEARGLPGVAIAIVEAGEGMPGMFIRAKDTECVNYTIRRNNCGSSSQWQLEKTISLDSRHLFIDSTGRHLFLYQCPRRSLDAGCFSLDLKTFQLETVFVSKSFAQIVYAYSNFPPSLLSTPTVSSGFGNKAEEEMLEQGGAASASAESPRSE